MAQIDEIARDLYRISIHVPQFDLQFNHFLVRDEEPLLFHTGMRQMFPALWEAVGRLIDPTSLRWISWSHFEVDECGALNEWLTRAPNARAACGQVGAMVNVTDYAIRPPLALAPGDVLTTGRHRFRWVPTPHLPHGWDAGMLFDEGDRVLFCSDLFHQEGDVEPSTSADVVGRFRETLVSYQQGPLANYLPYTPHTEPTLQRLAALKPRTLAAMHGSTFVGDGARAINDLTQVLKDVLAAG